MSNNEFMLTTIDNPFDPFEQFALWDSFDREKGYNTTSYLGRIVQFTDDMSQIEENQEVERAIDEILELNPLDVYVKIKRGDEIPFNKQQNTGE